MGIFIALYIIVSMVVGIFSMVEYDEGDINPNKKQWCFIFLFGSTGILFCLFIKYLYKLISWFYNDFLGDGDGNDNKYGDYWDED